MHAIKFLLSEHDRVRKMLAAIEKATSETAQRSKFEILSADLSHHEKMEEKIWYPFLKKQTDLSSTIGHLITEEKEASKKLAQLKKIKSYEKWKDSFLEFKNAVEHHAKEEETKLFPKVEKQIETEELKEIGSQMQKFKKELDEQNQ